MTRTTFDRSLLLLAVLCLMLSMLALSALSASAQDGPRTAPKDAYAAIVAGNLADYLSTETALQRPGTRELNPLMQTPARRVAVKAIGTGVQLWAVHQLGQRHPRLARVVGYTLGGVLTGVAMRNLEQGR